MRLPIFLAALAMAVSPTVGAFAAPAANAPVARAPQPGEADYTPEGAPRDDYNFTAWCRGVLEGHMALAERVQSVLPLDEVQQKIGTAYLKGYDEALRIGRKGRSDAEIDAAEAIRFAARANWNTAMQADLQLGADTYLAWQLPGRCEHAAKRVAKRDDIFNMAPSTSDVEAMGSNISANDELVGRAPPPAAPAPARVIPTPTAAVADAGAAGPVVMDDSGAPAEGVSVDALTVGAAGDPVAEAAPPVEEAAPATAAPADPPPPPAAAPAPARGRDGKLLHMPRKGRLFPWGKRE